MKISEHSQMMKHLTRPMEQPSKDLKAELVDDVVPGPLKDELEGKSHGR